MQWKSMYNGYLVSEYGDVKNDKTQHILKPYTHHKGYLKFTLKGKKYFAHRLVGIYFIPNPLGKPQINHIDGNKLNNHYTNLEWNTNQENNAHAVQMKLIRYSSGESHMKTTISTQDVLDVRASTDKVKDLAIKYNVAAITIYKIRQGVHRKYE